MIFGVFDLLAREALMEKVKIKMKFIFIACDDIFILSFMKFESILMSYFAFVTYKQSIVTYKQSNLGITAIVQSMNLVEPKM